MGYWVETDRCSRFLDVEKTRRQFCKRCFRWCHEAEGGNAYVSAKFFLSHFLPFRGSFELRRTKKFKFYTAVLRLVIINTTKVHAVRSSTLAMARDFLEQHPSSHHIVDSKVLERRSYRHVHVHWIKKSGIKILRRLSSAELNPDLHQLSC